MSAAAQPVSEFDAGPLSWVQGEIDQALARGLDALASFIAHPSDHTFLRQARMHVHQAAGALQIVGLDGVVAFVDEIERQLAHLEQLEATEVAAGSEQVDRACRKLQIFLRDVVNGALPVPLKLFPEYDAMQRLRGVRASSPTDLFHPDLERGNSRTRRPAAVVANAHSHLVRQRRQYQSGLLEWLRGEENGARSMRDAIAVIEEATTPGTLRTFWWTTRALHDALIEGGLDASFGVKQLAARIDLQIRRLVEGSGKVADRLRREVLYYVAISAPVTPSVVEVQSTFGLATLIPSPEVLHEDLLRIQPHVREGREQLVHAKDAWLKLTSGRAENLPQLRDTLASVHRHAGELGNPPLVRLVGGLAGRLEQIASASISEPVAMEFATALLLAENAFGNAAALPARFAGDVDTMLARIDAAREARVLHSAAPAPVVDEMSRRAQERLLLAQVGREIQANLRHMEQVLDAFFRDHARRAELATLARDSEQIRGALRMLGLDRAAELLASCQQQIDTYADPATPVTDDDLELLAESLSGLGFYVEAVEQQRADHERLIEPLLRRRRGEAHVQEIAPDSVEIDVANTQAALPELVAACDVDQDESARAELKARLTELGDDARLIGNDELAGQARAALRDLDAGAAPAEAVAAIIESGSPLPAEPVAEETQRLLAAEDSAVDDEILGVFITEAREVLDTIGAQYRLLTLNPGDREALRTTRRQFHTLKGSGRMVGLAELGDVAWAVEKLQNRLLEEDRPVTPAVLAMIGVAESEFRRWVGQIVRHGHADTDPVAVHDAIAAVEDELPRPRTRTAAPPVSAVPPLVASPTTPERSTATAVTPEATPAPEAAPEPEPIVVSLPEPEPVVGSLPEPIVASLPEPIVGSEPEPIVASLPEPEPIVGSLPEPIVASLPEPEPIVASEPEPIVASLPEPSLPISLAAATMHDAAATASPAEASVTPAFAAPPVLDIAPTWDDPPAPVPFIEHEVSAELPPAVAEELVADLDDALLEDQLAVTPDQAPVQEPVARSPDIAQMLAAGALDDVADELEAELARDLDALVELPELGLPVELASADDEITLGAIAVPPEDLQVLEIPSVAAPEIPSVEVPAIESIQAPANVELAALDAAPLVDLPELGAPATVVPTIVEVLALHPEQAVAAPADELAPVDAPVMAPVEAPVAETPIAAAVTEAPVAEALIAEAPIAEAPIAEAPAADAPIGPATPIADDSVAAPAGIEADLAADAPDVTMPDAPAPMIPVREAIVIELPLTARAREQAEQAREERERSHELVDASASADFDALPSDDIRIGDVALSRTLYELLVAEADGHLDVLGHELGLMQFDPSHPPGDDMVRASHTLCGIHRTAGFPVIAETAKALEYCLAALQESPLPLSAAAQPVMTHAVSALAGLVGRLKAGRAFEPADIAEAEAVQRELEALRVDSLLRARPAPVVPPQPVEAEAKSANEADPAVQARADATKLDDIHDDVDAQLLPIFLEEAEDLFPQAGEQIRAWRRNPADASNALALRRTLHTFKGSARMAGAMRLGELTHRMESRLLEGDAVKAGTPELFEALDADLDRVAFVLDALREGRTDVALPWDEEAPAVVEAARAEATAPAAAPVVVPLPGTDIASQAPDAVAATADAESSQRAVLRVRADMIDRLVNEAGEVAIARGRIEGELRTLKASLLELTNNVIRMRAQVREIEIHAESQIQSRLSMRQDVNPDFDPLEFDRFTRFQELTRSLSEGVNDVSTVQQGLLRNLDETDAALVAQARLSREMQQKLLSMRTVPFGSLGERLYRILRQVAKELDKRVNLDIQGAQVELDRSVLEKLAGPLEHLLRNALDHGIEPRDVREQAGKSPTGQIVVGARQVGNEIVLELTDDGAGLDLERIRMRAVAQGRLAPDARPSEAQLVDCIFEPGFSTASRVTAVSGRGIGMDVVRADIAALGGRVEVTTHAGAGTSFTLYLPLTLAVAQAVLVRAGGRLWALPAPMVEQVQQIKAEELLQLYGAQAMQWQGRDYPLHYLPRLLGDAQHVPAATRFNPVLLLRSAQGTAAVHVDEMVGNQEVVVKNIGPQLARVSGIAGATVLGTGEIVLIINPVQLSQRGNLPGFDPHAEAPVTHASRGTPEPAGPPVVLVVDDSLTVRKITTRMLTREGFDVVTAKDGLDALQVMAARVPDVLLLDIEMPRMDGFELTRTMKAEPRLAHIPIVMITSRTAEKHRNRARELGVDLYLGKPYQEDELLGHLREMLAVTA